MKYFARVLVLLLVVEVVSSAWLLGNRWLSPAPPSPDLTGLDRLSSSEIEALSRRAATGSAADWARLGEAYLGVGFFPAAEQCFRRAVELDPQNDQALYELGFSLERMGLVRDAIPFLERASRTTDAELAATCRYQIGRCWLRQERPREAEAVFRAASDYPASRYQLAKLLVRDGRAESALPLIDAGLRDIPGEMKLLQLKAQACDLLGRTAEAQTLRDAVERSTAQLKLEYSLSFTGLFRARLGLGRILAQVALADSSGELEQRVVATQTALRLIRQNELWYFARPFVAAARLELDQGRPAEALAILDEVESHNETTPEMIEVRGDALVLQGRNDDGFRLWKRANLLNPSPGLQRKLAEMERVLDDSAAQKQYLSRAAELQGVTLFRDNKLEAAAAELLQAVKLDPANVRAWYYRGEVERAQAQTEAARTAYETCLHLNPHHHRAQARLRNLDVSTGTGDSR